MANKQLEILRNLQMDKNYWAIHFGEYNKFANLGYEKGFIAVGWRELKKDLSSYRDLTRQEFAREIYPHLAKTYPNLSKNSLAQSLGQLFRFCALMKIGDIILMPKSDEGKIYFGIIDSDYFYEENSDDCDYKHRRKVKWIKVLDISQISQKLKHSVGGIMTVFSISEHSQEIDTLLQNNLVNAEIQDIEEFGMESHLEDFIVENWKKLDLGKRYNIYSEEGEITGKQYVTPIGRIDILAKSKDGKEWLVIELKKGRSADDVVGQTLRYMGWVTENEAKNGEKVSGLIIAGVKDEKLFYALKTLSNVKLMTYIVSFRLKREKI